MTSTISTAKQSFLTTQTTILSQPLAPSRTWTTANDASDDGLPERVVSDALFQLNHLIQQHCRRVHAPQATRNIAEQINHLYNQDAERRVGGEDDLEGGIGRELDLTLQETIDQLPTTWVLEQEVKAYPMEAKNYADAVAALNQLNEQRKELAKRIARIKHLSTIVEPLRTNNDDGEGSKGIQENVLTRNGPVEKELERMRMLLARVGGRVHALGESPRRDEEARGDVGLDGGRDGLKLAGKRRVDEFLADKGVFPD